MILIVGVHHCALWGVLCLLKLQVFADTVRNQDLSFKDNQSGILYRYIRDIWPGTLSSHEIYKLWFFLLHLS